MDHGGPDVLGHTHEALLQRFRQIDGRRRRAGAGDLSRGRMTQAVPKQVAATSEGQQQEDSQGSTKNGTAHGLHSTRAGA
jgi:hypothetical protein